MPFTKRQFLQATAAVTVALNFPARAQSGVGKIVVGFPPGGTVDVVARRLADKIKGTFAENVIVDSKPGAGGRIALEGLKNAGPDNLTAVLTPSSMIVVYPHVYRKLTYAPTTDFAAVMPVCANALAFVAGPAVPANVKTLAQFVEWAKVDKKGTYGSPAAGSMLHFMGIVFRNKAGIELTHVPYRGMAPAIQDLLGGNVTTCLGTLGDFLPYLASGKLRPLAVTSPQRSRFMPTVPTFAEQGYAEATGMDWFGLLMHAKTSPETVAKLRAAVRTALADPATIETLDKLGFEPLDLTPAAFSQRIKQETDYWAPIVKASGFSAED